jgi:hypothetical protein
VVGVDVDSPKDESLIASFRAENNSLPSFDQIQQRAYELFVARGATHGCDLEDWFAAEQELIATSVGH